MSELLRTIIVWAIGLLMIVLGYVPYWFGGDLLEEKDKRQHPIGVSIMVIAFCLAAMCGCAYLIWKL